MRLSHLLCLAIGSLLRADVRPHAAPTYAELAQARLAPAVDHLAQALARLDANILPHEAKELRKTIATARDLVDVFWFAVAGSKDGAFWVHVRDELDEGYELVGAFKDLFDAQGLTLVDDDTPDDAIPDDAVREQDVAYRHSLQRRRHRALRWATRFRSQLSELARRVRGPFASANTAPPPSRFYWAAAQLRPSRDLTGHENLRRLLAGLARASAAEADAVAALADPAQPSDQERFHDFRKQLRSIVRLTDLFPEIVSAREGVETLRRSVADYGAIEDLIVAHAAAVEHGERESRKIRRKIDERWQRLRARRELGHVLGALAARAQPVIPTALADRPSRDPCPVGDAAPPP
jgi:hypothetical protein